MKNDGNNESVQSELTDMMVNDNGNNRSGEKEIDGTKTSDDLAEDEDHEEGNVDDINPIEDFNEIIDEIDC